jgi:hypothetical protein
MEHVLNPFGKDRPSLEQIFSTISKGNTVLFLGAGASVTEKKYLSQELIDYYEDKIGKCFGINNITEFVDVLSENSSFSRSEFDTYVFELLNKLNVTDVQNTILNIRWRDIITTNFDLLLEKADYRLKEKETPLYDLVPIRSVKEWYQLCDNSQVRYIKLNGCMSDKSKYPFLFSSNDFQRAKTYYKTVLENMRVLSDRITFLSVGYSFSDQFSRDLLTNFDKFNYRDKKWIWSVDPFVNEHKLPYYSKNHICIIKCDVKEFFSEYRKWEEKDYASRIKKSGGIFVTSSRKTKVNISNKLSYNLRGIIEQLNASYQSRIITEDKFYKGEEPSYTAIERGYDVVRRSKLNQVRKDVENIIVSHHSLAPIIFLTGNFGTGKTTFNYRLIHELITETDRDATAFEILDIDRLRREDLKELIEMVRSKYFILYCNNVEIDSVYKSIIELRTFISTLQLSEVKVFFLLSIRENILEIHKKSRTAKSVFEYNVDSKLTRVEVEDLLERLKNNNLVNFRDVFERNRLVQKVESKYAGDSFITLLDTVTDGKHIENLRDAYFQLSKPCQKAFVFTALVHQHNLYIPSSILRNLVSTDWEEFRKNVINVEGRGILIQEDVPMSKGTEPDLYFRTKHPIIANKLISEIHPREEKRFSLYKDVVTATHFAARNTKFLINLFKAVRGAMELSDSRIDQLFDLADKTFYDDPHFLLHYAINLQSRGSKADIEVALERIKYAESLLDSRNDRFIHRKGCLYARLAKLYYKEERTNLNLTFKYINESKDWLLLKQQLDPCSSFSYKDLIELLIWELEKIKFSPEEEIRKQIQVEELLDLAMHAVTDDLSQLIELKDKFDKTFRRRSDNKGYLITLHEMYEDVKLRPLACILFFNHFNSVGEKGKANEYLLEMEEYTDEDEVAKFLFKEFGRNLNDPNIRMKFFRLSKSMEWYAEENPLRYYYNNFVAESYNTQFHAANTYLRQIVEKYQYLNPEFQRVWLNPDSDQPREFAGKVGKSKRGFKTFVSSDFPTGILFTKNGIEKVDFGTHCVVNIHFYLNGLRAVYVCD